MQRRRHRTRCVSAATTSSQKCIRSCGGHHVVPQLWLVWLRARFLAAGVPARPRVRVGPSSGAAYPAFDANLTRQQERPAAIKCAWVATWLLQKRCASSERPRSPHNATLRVLLQRKRGLRPGPEISAVRGACKHRPPRWCVCVVCLTCPHCVLFCYPSLAVRWYRLEKAKDRDTQTKTERDFV